MTLFADSLPDHGYTTDVTAFQFECSGRATDVNVSVPDRTPEGAPACVVLVHGQGKQMGQRANDMYEMVVEHLCRTGLFSVLRPLMRDGQDASAEGEHWKERMKETNELINRRRQLAVFNDGPVGGIGHSYGTDSVFGCCGVVNEGKSTTIINPNLAAIMLLSPMVDDTRQSVPASFADIRAHMLSITGTQDFVREQGADAVVWRTQPHRAAPTSIVRTKFVHLYGHDHAGAVGTPNEPELDDPATAAAVCDSILAFACAHLLPDGETKTKATKWLVNGAQKWGVVLDDYEHCEIGERADA